MNTKVLYITYMGLTEPLLESQALAYLRNLARKDNFIYVLSFEKARFVSKESILRIRRDLKELNINWIFLRYHKGPIFFAKAIDLLAGFIAAFYIVLKNGIKVIHVRGSMPAFFAFFVSKILGRKFIFDVRGLMAREYVDGGVWKSGGFYYRIANRLEKIILKYSDSIVVLTERIRHIIGAGSYTGFNIINRISVIPSAVDTALFSVKCDTTEKIRKKMRLGNRFIFLYIGSLGTWYMFEEMIEFIKVNRTNFKDPFVLVVTQSDSVKAKEILEKANFSDSDYAVIYSEHKEIPAYINLADAGMMFIKPCFSKKASCPTKFAEYLACGVPVVLNTGIGDCDRIIRDYNTGVLVEGFNAEEYLNAGERLRKIIEVENNIADRCRETAIRGFSLGRAVDIYNRIYKEL